MLCCRVCCCFAVALCRSAAPPLCPCQSLIVVLVVDTALLTPLRGVIVTGVISIRRLVRLTFNVLEHSDHLGGCEIHSIFLRGKSIKV